MVPIIGSPVKITVGEIVTNCWLQMSLEGEALLEPSSNDLFTPIPIMKEAMPLRDCVISIRLVFLVKRSLLYGGMTRKVKFIAVCGIGGLIKVLELVKSRLTY